MAAYVIADVTVTDPVAYEEYRKDVLPSVERAGGRFLVRGGAIDVLEGDYRPTRLVVIEFPSLEAARAWYDSDEYRRLKALRQRASTGRLFLVRGV